MIYLTKFITLLGTLGSGLVYNFHKPISGIKTKRNLKYNQNANRYQKFDVNYHKLGGNNKPMIVYFHGGGWMGYSKGIYTTLCRRLAKMGFVVFNVNYGLAPKYKIDSIVADAITAINYARSIASDYGADPNKIILAGDSAGAHISSLVAGKLSGGEIDAREILEAIKGLILLYGVYDLTTMQTSKFPNIRTYAKASLKGKGKDMQENDNLSPINYVDSKFPPCFLASGKIDKLYSSQSEVMYNKLKDSGVKVKKLFFDKSELRAVHAYMIFDGLATNVETLKAINKFLIEVT